MIEKTTCKYCGWEFPSGFLQSITENNDSVFCENCGTKLINENPISDILKSEENPNQDLKIKKTNKKKAIFNRIYENIRSEKSPIDRVLMDSDFPKVFKDNFKIVISRVIYSHIRALEIESAINIKSVELTKDLLDELYKEINPVLTMRIKSRYLGNLHKSSIRDFEKKLKLLQTKLKLNKRFHQDFIIYLRRLIREVYIIVSELWNEKDLPKFERIIRDDLKNFACYNSSSGFEDIQTNALSDNIIGANITPKILSRDFHGLAYVVTDKRVEKVYVGQTIRALRDRFAEHLRDPPNKYFREAVNFYKKKGQELEITSLDGKSLATQNSEFIIEIIGEARSQEELNKLEIKEIKNRKSCVLDYFTIKDGQIIPLYGYNIQRGGSYSVLSLKGKIAITYNHISRGQLKTLIKRGLFVSEIAQEFMVPDLIIITKVQEFWASDGIFTIDQARKAFGGYDIYKSRMKHIPTGLPSSTSFSEDQLKKLVDLIKNGYSTPQMKFEMNIDNSDLYLMLKVLGFSTFTSARDQYGSTELFYKKCRETLINSVKRGKAHSNYIEVDEGFLISLIEQNQDYKVIAQKLKIAERTVYDKSYELLDMSLPEAERIYRIYPKIEKKLLAERDSRKRLKTSFFQDLITNGLSVEEIDKEFLKILIALGYTKKELEILYGWDHNRMTRWIANTLRMDFYRATDEFWWKSRIIWLFKLGYSARQMRDVSLGLIGKHVTHDVLTRIFAEEYSIHGSNTWKFLQKLYGP